MDILKSLSKMFHLFPSQCFFLISHLMRWKLKGHIRHFISKSIKPHIQTVNINPHICTRNVKESYKAVNKREIAWGLQNINMMTMMRRDRRWFGWRKINSDLSIMRISTLLQSLTQNDVRFYVHIIQFNLWKGIFFPANTRLYSFTFSLYLSVWLFVCVPLGRHIFLICFLWPEQKKTTSLFINFYMVKTSYLRMVNNDDDYCWKLIFLFLCVCARVCFNAN